MSLSIVRREAATNLATEPPGGVATEPPGGVVAAPPGEPVLTLDGVTVTVHSGAREAVRDVSLTVRAGESVALVGESGSGKTLICRAALGILADGCVVSDGSVRLGEQDVTRLSKRGWRGIHGRRVGAVFQDPGGYLNPSIPVGQQVTEALRTVKGLSRKAARGRAIELLRAVGLREPGKVYGQLPAELSGGMQQRVLIAIAISGDPRLLVADEATTALDVTVQAEIIELIRSLRDERGLAVLFVSHDLAVVSELCDRVLVFYAGEVVEAGPTEEILLRPRHPYTRALLKVASLGDYRRRELDVIPGQPPAVGAAIRGCRFASRCASATPSCRVAAVALREVGAGQEVRCVRADEAGWVG